MISGAEIVGGSGLTHLAPWRHGDIVSRKRCAWNGCRSRASGHQQITPSSPFFGAHRLCTEHAVEFVRMAQSQWVDPETLEHVVYDGMAPQGYYRDYPCVGCGHPWFTHVGPGWYDGPCVMGCPECRIAGGGTPGYLPGRVRSDVPT